MKKKLLAAILCICMLLPYGCGGEGGGTEIAPPEQDKPADIDGGMLLENGSTKMLRSGGYRVDFVKGEDGYSVKLADVSATTADNELVGGDKTMFYQDKPAAIVNRVKIGASEKDKTYTAPYGTVTAKGYGYSCGAYVHTEKGSVYFVDDIYTVLPGGAFALYRSVTVTKAVKDDIGFESLYSLVSAADSPDYEAYEYFIPSILYKDTQNMTAGSIAGYLGLDKVYVKETRTGLPLAMLREKASGYTLSMSHYKPQISVNSMLGGGNKGAIDSKIQYGGIGYTIMPRVAVDFVYPCAEGPNTYNEGSSWAKRYHPVKRGTNHSYKLALFPDKNDTYTDAMTASFQEAYKAEDPKIAEMDSDKIYANNIEIFEKEYREYKNNNVVVAAGVPWSISLPDGKNMPISFQSGFVGQQIPVGYQLYRFGIKNNNADVKKKGEEILDFWASQKINGTYFPTVWWDPAFSSTGGTSRGYPAFLRCMVDAMEGMIDAYRMSETVGAQKTAWYNTVKKTADNLVAKQNEDGSFYRAYRTDGTVETSNEDPRTQGMSKLNTPIAVRFLSKMFELTKETKFKTAALKAADFAYDELYVKLGKYVGGTPDNPNVVDKEAAIYAMYCFNAAYALSGDKKYLPAAEHAAASVMSWTYCYDFAVPSQNATQAAMNPFENGGVSGFSIIATGHSAADNFSSYASFEMLRTYAETGNDFYLSSARLLHNNTKSNTDFDGRMKWKYKAMMPEASTVCDFNFGTVGAWLPWSGIANIEPLVNLYESFGTMQIMTLDRTAEQYRAGFDAYGIGGNPMQER